MFLSIFCNIWKLFLSFSHLNIHPVHGMIFNSIDNSHSASPFPMANRCGLASLWGSTLGLTELSRSITSFTTDCAVPSCWVSSWEKPGWDSRVVHPRSCIGSPRSFAHLSISFPLLTRPSMVFIPLWVACWGRTFNGIVHDNSQMRSFGRCRQRVAPVFPLSQHSYSRDLDFHNFSSPGFLKLWMIRSDGTLAISLLIGRYFAVTRSSHGSCWIRFAIVSEQTVELKWLILNKHNRWFHSSRVKLPLVRMSASWFLLSMYLIWIFGSKLIRSNTLVIFRLLTRRANTFPSACGLTTTSSTNPSASRNTFQCPRSRTATLGRGSQHTFLPLRWPDCTLSRLRAEEYDRPVTQSKATPEPSSRTIPTLDRTLVAR